MPSMSRVADTRNISFPCQGPAAPRVERIACQRHASGVGDLAHATEMIRREVAYLAVDLFAEPKSPPHERRAVGHALLADRRLAPQQAGVGRGDAIVLLDLPHLPPAQWTGCGSGFAVHAQQLRNAYADRVVRTEADLVPHAREIAALAAIAFARDGGKPAEEALPVYVRNKVALTMDEQR